MCNTPARDSSLNIPPEPLRSIVLIVASSIIPLYRIVERLFVFVDDLNRKRPQRKQFSALSIVSGSEDLDGDKLPQETL